MRGDGVESRSVAGVTPERREAEGYLTIGAGFPGLSSAAAGLALGRVGVAPGARSLPRGGGTAADGETAVGRRVVGPKEPRCTESLVELGEGRVTDVGGAPRPTTRCDPTRHSAGGADDRPELRIDGDGPDARGIEDRCDIDGGGIDEARRCEPPDGAERTDGAERDGWNDDERDGRGATTEDDRAGLDALGLDAGAEPLDRDCAIASLSARGPATPRSETSSAASSRRLRPFTVALLSRRRGNELPVFMSGSPAFQSDHTIIGGVTALAP